MGLSSLNTMLFGYLAMLALGLALVLATVAGLYVRRLERRTPLPLSDEIGSAKAVIHKARKRQPMSAEELHFARQVVADRSNAMAFCIPGALFMVGCFYIFGSLYHLHGATPSERTFLGVFPMLAATNFTVRMLNSARLKRRLRRMP